MSRLFDGGFSWVEAGANRLEKIPADITSKPQISDEFSAESSRERTTLVLWREGLSAMQKVPRPDWVDPSRWKQLLADADWFMMAWAEDAQRLGWSAGDLFGTPISPWSTAVDQLGLVPLLRGRSVSAITADTATITNRIGDPNVMRLYPWRVAGIPMWESYARVRPC